jgi:hypothetical protein
MTKGPIGSIRSSATATCLRRTTGSSSRSSVETQAKERFSRAAQCASSVVFP